MVRNDGPREIEAYGLLVSLAARSRVRLDDRHRLGLLVAPGERPEETGAVSTRPVR